MVQTFLRVHIISSFVARGARGVTADVWKEKKSKAYDQKSNAWSAEVSYRQEAEEDTSVPQSAPKSSGRST